VLRRHLEAQHDSVQTRGFAGFFGLPIQYQATDANFSRPQLPGLLAPALSVRAAGNAKQVARNQSETSWSKTGESPAAMFSLVEASGPYYLWKLLRDSFYPDASCDPASTLIDKSDLKLARDQQPLALEEQVELAAGILHAMGLTENFADSVLLVGHGAESPNNPQAASLNCGACGGQSGEFNALVLAALLNDKVVRSGLAERDIVIPEQTRFVAALHETVTDELRVADGTTLPARISTWLKQASVDTRRERAVKLGLESASDAGLEKTLIRRARDWSQVRPEWGLAGNAAFIVAPRERTRGIDLEGRTFLHDYSWQNDPDLSVLELIMTAPMVVTHWINMQYNASVVDNERYGSGNKVLHNVVGGNIGVFEGNGGDLRIGLPMQSIHNGDRWMHLPLRLSVYIAAPADAITEIYQRHEVVRQLIDNDWLYLFRLNDDGSCHQLYREQWLEPGSNQ
ncbi:MAG: putative inorganic carbon transporter subunit DabA, partial [Pseudohongiellaceae bacterium]